MKALLIIDMQLGSFRPYALRHDTHGVIERINALSDLFHRNNDKVIFIQHDGTRDNNFLPGTEDWSVLPELIRHPDDIEVSKTANDVFYKSNLQEILDSHGISELFITGCATDFCVDTTIKSALHKDYHVIVIEDAHTTADRKGLPAVAVIEYYNWLWSEMLPTNSAIQLVKTIDVLK